MKAQAAVLAHDGELHPRGAGGVEHVRDRFLHQAVDDDRPFGRHGIGMFDLAAAAGQLAAVGHVADVPIQRGAEAQVIEQRRAQGFDRMTLDRHRFVDRLREPFEALLHRLVIACGLPQPVQVRLGRGQHAAEFVVQRMGQALALGLGGTVHIGEERSGLLRVRRLALTVVRRLRLKRSAVALPLRMGSDSHRVSGLAAGGSIIVADQDDRLSPASTPEATPTVWCRTACRLPDSQCAMAQPQRATVSLVADSERRCAPAASKFSGASHVSKP